MKVIPFEQIGSSDLFIDSVYVGGRSNNIKDDPIKEILPVGNAGGFRPVNVNANNRLPNQFVLYSDGFHEDWPDYLDQTTGIYRYYGDNREPGPINGKSGNRVLERIFHYLNLKEINRIPPFFLFVKSPVQTQRDVKFLGIAVPGGRNIPITRSLISIWRESSAGRFQNYESLFTILDINPIPRKWIDDIIEGRHYESKYCPDVWKKWIDHGEYTPLIIPPRKKIRTKAEQLPSQDDKMGWKMLDQILKHFPTKNDAFRFEQLAANLYQASDNAVITIDTTRPSRDGGRDAVGEYRLGNTENNLIFDFNLEAKCYDPFKSSVGVKATSRLISRIRHRMFGVLVTTSYLNHQAYQEIVEDEHPIMIITGRDIIEILKGMGLNNISLLNNWLKRF